MSQPILCTAQSMSNSHRSEWIAPVLMPSHLLPPESTEHTAHPFLVQARNLYHYLVPLYQLFSVCKLSFVVRRCHRAGGFPVVSVGQYMCGSILWCHLGAKGYLVVLGGAEK